MRIQVTGADGFIGSHLVERLVRDGHSVTALCVYNSNGELGWLENSSVRDEIDIRLGDIRDSEFMRNFASGSDVLLHLAALIAIPYSYQAPRSFVETNVLGTLNVLEACKAAGCRMINTSTSEVYGTPDTTPITESHPLKGQSPYSASKIAADQLCFSYAMSFGMDVATLRPFNTYGPRQSRRAVIPTILQQLLAGNESIHLGSLSPKRDFTYVGDTVDGFVRSAVQGLPAGTVTQLGTGRTVSIGDLLEACVNVVGHRPNVITDAERVRPDGSEVEILLSDPSKAFETLEWKPQIDLETGIKLTAEWISEHADISRSGEYAR